MEYRHVFHSFAFLLTGPALALSAYPAAAATAADCDAGKWPLSAVQKHFDGTLPALGTGDALPALGRPRSSTCRCRATSPFRTRPAGPARPIPPMPR